MQRLKYKHRLGLSNSTLAEPLPTCSMDDLFIGVGCAKGETRRETEQVLSR